MGQFIIEYPDPQGPDIRDTLSLAWGYQDNVPNPDYDPVEFLDPPDNLVPNPSYDPNVTIANPQSKLNFIKATIARYVKDVYKNTKGRIASDAERVISDAAAEAVDIS